MALGLPPPARLATADETTPESPIRTRATRRVYAADDVPQRTIGSSRRRWLPHIAIVTSVAIAARLVTFGNPHLHVDEQFYLTVARAMASGKLLYVDVWDRKPVGIFLLYLPAALLPVRLGVWLCQAMALVSVVLTALLIAALAGRAGGAAPPSRRCSIRFGSTSPMVRAGKRRCSTILQSLRLSGSR